MKFENWLRNKNLKEKTIEEYLYYFSKFQDTVFNQETVSRFLVSKSNRNGVARSFLVNLKKYIIQNYKELGFSIEQRLDASEVELPTLTGSIKKRIIKTLDEEQIKLLEKYLESEKEKLMLLCSYFGGLRVGELMKIRVIDFNWNEWKKDISQIGECNVLGKGDKEGVAFFPSELMVRVAKYIKTKRNLSLSSTIFIKHYHNYRNVNNAASAWNNKLKEAAIKAGITKMGENEKIVEETSIHSHMLRHSYATNLLKKGVDIRKIQELLRHSVITSTEVYTHVSKEDLKKVLLESKMFN